MRAARAWAFVCAAKAWAFVCAARASGGTFVTIFVGVTALAVVTALAAVTALAVLGRNRAKHTSPESGVSARNRAKHTSPERVWSAGKWCVFICAYMCSCVFPIAQFGFRKPPSDRTVFSLLVDLLEVLFHL